MPEICRFFGIVITMNFDDHVPPHFHARYGAFAPLQDPDYVAKARVNPELGVISWPNEADIDPDD